MAKRRKRRSGVNIASLRNLPQYKDFTDDEILKRVTGKLDRLIDEEMKNLEKDYDLSDMKYNDVVLIERWVALMIRLRDSEEDLEHRIQAGELGSNEALTEEKRLSTMRDDMLKIQRSLAIDRAKRRDSSDDDPRLLFADIRKRAKRFYQERLCYVKCPNCNLVICTANFLYPDSNNRVLLTCARCDTESEWTSQELVKIEKDNPYS